MKARKSVTEDPGVKAAIEALKAAVLAVNGDAEIVGLVTLITIGNPKGLYLVSEVQSCSCMQCMHRNYQQFADAMMSHVQDAAAQGRQTRH